MKKNRFSLKMPAGYNRAIHAAVLILNLFGVLMVISASMSTDATNGSLLFAGAKELGFVVISYVLMIFTARNFSFKFVTKYQRIISLCVIAVLLSVLVFPPVNGARAWLRFGPITIQPAEFAKIWVIILVAINLGDKQRHRVAKTWDLVKEPLIFILIFSVIIIALQKDLGSAVVLLGVGYMCFLVPSNRKLDKFQKYMTIFLLVGIVLVVFLGTETGLHLVESILSKIGAHDYMLGRFKSSADPLGERYGDSYQLFMSLVAMIQGLDAGLFGKGYGNSLNKLGYLPEAHTDFVLAIVVEELGILGILVVLVGYGVILYNTFKYALYVKLERDKVILVGVASYLMIHFVFNVGGVTGLVPLTGVPLLFVSAGGSSKMAIMIAIGLVQHVISNYNVEQKVLAQKKRMEQQSL